MALRLKLQLVVVDDDDQQVSVDELVVLNKDHERPEHLGLTLTEAKALLLELQRQILNRQMAAFLATRVPCPRCGRPRGKGSQAHRLPNPVRGARPGQPAAAPLSVPAQWAGVHQPPG